MKFNVHVAKLTHHNFNLTMYYFSQFNREYIPLDPSTPKIKQHPASRIFGAAPSADAQSVPQTSMQGGGDQATVASKVSFRSLKNRPQFPQNV